MHRERFYTLTASCPDRVGIVAAVSGFFAQHGGWILETTLHSEPPNEEGIAAYFMRLEVKADSLPFDLEGLRAAFKPVADEFKMTWRVSDSARRKRVVILVSKQEMSLRPARPLAVKRAGCRHPLRDLESRDTARFCRMAWHPVSLRACHP